jgi:cobalt-zinc-cadmium efflux system membrane fusion protein
MNRLWIGVALVAAAACGSEREHGDHHDGEESGPAAGDRMVRLSAAGVDRSGIEVGKVTAEPLVGAVEVPAEVQLNPDRLAHVTTLVEGQVGAVHAKLGDRVDKGDVLATLTSVALGEARAEQARAASAVEQARAEYERQKQLRAEGIGAERKFLEAKGELDRAQSQLRAARSRLRVYGGGGRGGASVAIRSPLAGVVIERHATPGEVVDGDRPLFVVADVGRVWVVGRVYEQDVAAATVGAPATVTLQAYPGRSWSGEVGYVAAVLDERTRTLPIRVELDNPTGELRPGLFGRIALVAPDRGSVPTVPESAVVTIDDHDTVFVPAGETGLYRAVPVGVGARARGLVELRSGLEIGDPIVTRGVFILKSELLRGQLGEHHH